MPDPIIRPQPQNQVSGNYAYDPFKNGNPQVSEQKTYNSSNASGVNFTNATNYADAGLQAMNSSTTSVGASTIAGGISGASLGTMIVPGLGTAIGAGIGALGGLVGSLFKRHREKKNREYNEQQIEKQNEFNAQEAEKANERTRENMLLANDLQNANYEKYYSYEAQVRQMKEAGLNPASMYNQGTQGVGGNVSASASPSASSAGAASTPLSNDAEIQGAATNLAHLQLDALSVGASNTRTLADATRISIDNSTANQRNISEILKNYAEIERLKKAGMLDDATSNKINAMLSAELSNVYENTRLTSITADNTESVMKSTANSNNASATNSLASAGLSKQKTATEAYNTDEMKYKSLRENLTFQDQRDQFTIANDICDKYGIDRRYRQNIRDLIQNVAQKSGVDLINLTAKTLFSWLDFANWKTIFAAHKYTKSSEAIAEKQLEQQMKLINHDWINEDAELKANWFLLSKSEQDYLYKVSQMEGAGPQVSRQLAKKLIASKKR